MFFVYKVILCFVDLHCHVHVRLYNRMKRNTIFEKYQHTNGCNHVLSIVCTVECFKLVLQIVYYKLRYLIEPNRIVTKLTTVKILRRRRRRT